MSEESDTGICGYCPRHDVAQRALVVGVGVGMHQRDRQRLDAGRAEIVDQRWSAAFRSSGLTTSPRAFIRSGMPRVSASEASGSGLSMLIQPNSGPGVQALARCSVYSKPCGHQQADAGALAFQHGVGRDRRAVQDHVDVGGRDAGLLADQLARRRRRRSTGLRASMASWPGRCAPALSSCSNRSVKVPPTSTPSLIVLSSHRASSPLRPAPTCCMRIHSQNRLARTRSARAKIARLSAFFRHRLAIAGDCACLHRLS